MLHRRRCFRFRIPENLSFSKLDVACVPPAVIPVHRHQGVPGAAPECILDSCVIAIEIRVAVQDEKRRPEQRSRVAQSPTGAEQAVTVGGVSNLQPEARSIPDKFGNPLTEMTCTQYDLPYTLPGQHSQLVRNEWLAPDR
jgi:hypothetical protein